MKIVIKKIKENPDGSADVEVHYDQEGLQFLVEQGLTCSIVEAIMTKETGEFYGISSVLDTLPKKSKKRVK